MKRIIIVNSNMKIGGVQKSLYNLLWELSGRYDVTLMLFSSEGDYLKNLPPDVKVMSAGGPCEFLGTSQCQYKKTSLKFWKRGFWAALTKTLGRPFAMKGMFLFQKDAPGEYDCAISFLHNESPKAFYGGINEYVLKKVKAKKKFAFLHCDYQTSGANAPSNNRLYERFDRIAACSQGCRRVFLQAAPHLESKCCSVHNCTRFDEVRKLADSDPVTYPDHSFAVVTVARFSPVKGLHRALQAVAFAVAQGIDLEYHIVGDGKTRASLEAMVQELKLDKRVVFHGEQENPYRFIRNADLFLLTSYHEAAPLVIDEAMYLAIPVLSMRTSSSDEMILDQGGGWVCENEQNALNEMLVQVLRDPKGMEEKKNHLRSVTRDNQVALREFVELLEDGYEYD